MTGESIETIERECIESLQRSMVRRQQKRRRPWWWWLSLWIVMVALAVPVASILYLLGIIQP